MVRNVDHVKAHLTLKVIPIMKATMTPISLSVIDLI